MKNFRWQQRPKKSMLIFGLNEVEKALLHGKSIDKIYLNEKMISESWKRIKKLAFEHQIPINRVPESKLTSFNVQNHEGVVAIISKIIYQDLQDTITFIVEQGLNPLLLILDGITDIRNIGGIARTAFAMGVHALIIPDKGVGALNEDAILTSAGALEKLTVCRVNSLMKAIDLLHLNGIKVFASEISNGKNITEENFTMPCAVVIGSEEIGIHPTIKKNCDDLISIPMPGGFESLNVSVANGIILYEIMQQRNK